MVELKDIVFNMREVPKVLPSIDTSVVEIGRMYALRTNIKFVKTSTEYIAYTGKYGNHPIRRAPTANKLFNLMRSYIDSSKSQNKEDVVKRMFEILIKEDPNISEHYVENIDMRRIRLALESYFRKNPSKTSLYVCGFNIEKE